MNYAVISVEALENYNLLLTFKTGEKKIYDMKPHLDGGIFEELKDKNLFRKVRVSFDTIEWENGADFDPEVLYQDSILEKVE
jgi:hypothetical protein|tara:strand:- start:227 stop:472 length:246 start_codon:yes stop_codon:yes gene_type:complete